MLEMHHRSVGPHILPYRMLPCTLTLLRVGKYKPFYGAQIENYQYFQKFHLYKNCIYYKIQIEINCIHLFETIRFGNTSQNNRTWNWTALQTIHIIASSETQMNQLQLFICFLPMLTKTFHYWDTNYLNALVYTNCYWKNNKGEWERTHAIDTTM